MSKPEVPMLRFLEFLDAEEWKQQRTTEMALMADLVPYLQKLSSRREISGLNAYE